MVGSFAFYCRSHIDLIKSRIGGFCVITSWNVRVVSKSQLVFQFLKFGTLVIVIVLKRGFVCALSQNRMLVLSETIWDNEPVILLYSELNKFWFPIYVKTISWIQHGGWGGYWIGRYWRVATTAAV